MGVGLKLRLTGKESHVKPQGKLCPEGQTDWILGGTHGRRWSWFVSPTSEPNDSRETVCIKGMCVRDGVKKSGWKPSASSMSEASYTLAAYKWAMLNKGSHALGSVTGGKLNRGSLAQ